jgi:hypothetical protein
MPTPNIHPAVQRAAHARSASTYLWSDRPLSGASPWFPVFLGASFGAALVLILSQNGVI